MAAFAVDSGCMIALVSDWHGRHDAVTAAIGARLDRGERMVLPAHALAEAFAVLTRLPEPHRLSPADAWSTLSTNFVEHAAIAALSGVAYRRVLGRLVQQGIGGGRTYDAVIGESARIAKVDSLLTLNPRHFDPPPQGVTVVDPSA